LAGKDDDRDVFREAMRGVRPLVTAQRAGPARRRPLARARFTRADRAAVLHESLQPPAADSNLLPGDLAQFRQAGVPETVLRQLRRGQIRIDAEIDLHGLRLEEARLRLREFLMTALAHRWQGLRIVHGKGLRSGARGPVIKNAAHSLLRRSEAVLAFTSAAVRDGGAGATLVLMRLGRPP
jgi:DNA-nicking Smr family endonuclease